MELSKRYHFVATLEMYKKINNYSAKYKIKISKTVRNILELMLPILDYYCFFQKESSNFGYTEFGSEIDIKVEIDPNVYRKLKNVQGVMHSFSVAVIVRKMIELFFKYLENKGLIWLKKKMQSIKLKMKKIINKNGNYKKLQKSVVHMYGEELMEEDIYMCFSKNYTLLSVEFT